MAVTDILRRHLLKYDSVKRLNLRLKSRKYYRNSVRRSGNSKKILFWSTGGMVVQSHLEGVIAAALKMRGHDVRMVLCDGVYKACAKRVDFPEAGIDEWPKYCPSCIRHNKQLFDKLGLDYSLISDIVSEQESSELRKHADSVTLQNYRDLQYKGHNLFSHLESAMMRHTRGGSFEGNEDLLKEYAFTVLTVAAAARNAIRKFKPDNVYMSHGIYADWGPALSESLRAGIPVTSYICCYLNAHFYFGTVDKLDETFLNTSPEAWEKISREEFTEDQSSKLKQFLSNRYRTSDARDMKGILHDYKGDKDHFTAQYNLDPNKPVWGIMTHINWDAASDYFPMIHENFDSWLYETVRTIIDIDDVQWLIKIHPSEINDNPLTGCQKFIEKNFPDLPDHVKVIKMDDKISPLDFYGLLDGGVTVMGTGGLELALQKKPVILAGAAHYSGKGFTYDSKSDTEYKDLLKRAGSLKELDDKKHDLAMKYGYTYFISKQIPLLPHVRDDLKINFDAMQDLLPGRNKYIDLICDRIIDGEDFIIPEKQIDFQSLESKEQIRHAS